MKRSIAFLCFIISLFSCRVSERESTDRILEYVNPFIGTGGHGHTYPGATLPFGMVQLSPDSRLEGWDGCSGYHYTDSIIYGFSHTHLSGTGVSDYGDVLLMPTQGKVYFDNGYRSKSEESYRSSFQKRYEKASPGYYQVKLDKHDIDVRLTATLRAGIHEYTFNNEGKSNIILDLTHRDHLLKDTIMIRKNNIVEGKRVSTAWATEQHLYFSIEFSKSFENFQLDSSGKKAAFQFDLKEPHEKILVKVGISAVSMEGARKNLAVEAPHFEFESYLKDAQDMWEKELNKIQVEGESADQKTIFYTALYHTMIVPNTFSDVNGKYRGMDQMVHESDHTVYSIFSFWDTFRATHPLYTIIQQEKTNEFIRTFLKQYQDGGILPIWELAANYTGCMIGYHGVSVIADAYGKGIRNYDTELALEAMQYSASQNKLGLEAYKNKGFIEVSDEAESVSKVLEYAYDDWCIAQMGMQMKKDEVYQEYIARAQYYKNIFNPEVKFMQSKTNGGWSYGFNPAEVNFNFTEANSWQYSMFVPQDISGMIDLYGGEAAFESKLDQLFSTEMELSGRHQADITGLIGQYAHGNEPSHHMAYLYNYIGKPYKTQERIHQILTEQYTNQVDGLSGNEDCGQMSAWYVLSSLGFYSVTPGQTYYAIGTPHFKKAKIHLENGNTFSIVANNLSKTNKYIQSARLNGNVLEVAQLNHDDITKGGKLVFEMGDRPNKTLWNKNVHRTSIDSAFQIVAVPYFKASSRTFTDSLLVEILSLKKGDSVYYSLNNGKKVLYDKPVVIKEYASFSAYSQRHGKQSKLVQDVDFKKIKGGRSIQLSSSYENQYAAGGDKALIDLLKGNENFRTGYWQGYSGVDFSAVVDLGELETIQTISLGCLQDIKSWIWYPRKVTFSSSVDGKTFQKLVTLENTFSDKKEGAFVQEFEYLSQKAIECRFIKVEAEHYGLIPNWHLGSGEESWLFLDEISIE